MSWSGRARAVVSLLIAAAIFADQAEAQRVWAVGLAAEVDDDSNQSLLATFNWGLTERTWLTFSAGRSEAPSDRAGVRADTGQATIDHRFGIVGITFAAERWGDEDTLESTNLGGSVYLQNDRFRLALERENRDIDIGFTVTGPLGRTDDRTVGLTGVGTGLALRVELAERWQLYASRMDYDYSRNLTLLPRIDSLSYLSTSALTLADSFVDDMSSVGIEWSGPVLLVNAQMNRDRSAVDGTELSSLNAAVLFPVGRRLDLEINVGRSDSDLFGRSLYGGILLLVYGGG